MIFRANNIYICVEQTRGFNADLCGSKHVVGLCWAGKHRTRRSVMAGLVERDIDGANRKPRPDVNYNRADGRLDLAGPVKGRFFHPSPNHYYAVSLLNSGSPNCSFA